ncbi:phosphopyruvate hydratase, partial [Francisella tularensis subsp. holarctica]|nr:phosphopyruvate hydratase [Francisella tularensis subsp. holarctica]
VAGVGDEGGYAPDLQSNEAAIEAILKAVKESGYEPGKHVFIALDPESSEFYKDGKYELKSENKSVTTEELIDYYADWV